MMSNFERKSKLCRRMGPLQESINRSVEFANNSERTYLQGESKSTNHLVFEMNEFYLEMAQKLNEFKLSTYDNGSVYDDDNDEDVEDTDSVLYEVVNAIRKKRNDPEMKKQIEHVLKLDKMMEDSYKTLREERMERHRIQQQLCDIIDKEDGKDYKTKYFRDLCEFEDKQHMRIPFPAESQTDLNQNEHETRRHKPTEDEDKDERFIKRNIQLAKNTPTMLNPTYSLTDAEKLKLDQLLMDLEKNEKTRDLKHENIDLNIDKVLSSSEKNEENDSFFEADSTATPYPYSLSQEDQIRMRDIEAELRALENSESSVSIPAISSQTTPDRVQPNNKPWKVEERLKEIDAKLTKFQCERESFLYEPSVVPALEIEPHLRFFGRPRNESKEDEVVVTEETEDTDNTLYGIESISLDTLKEKSQAMQEKIACIVQKAKETQPDEVEVREYSDYENDEPERDENENMH